MKSFIYRATFVVTVVAGMLAVATIASAHNEGPAVLNNGVIEISKFECPSDTVLSRTENGYKADGSVNAPANCTPVSGAQVGYYHQAEVASVSDTIGDLNYSAAPLTDAAGKTSVSGLPLNGRYLVSELDGNGNRVTDSSVMGLYCTGSAGNWVSGQWFDDATLGVKEDFSFTYQPSSSAVKFGALQVYMSGLSNGFAFVDNATLSLGVTNLIKNSDFGIGLSAGWTSDLLSKVEADYDHHGKAPSADSSIIMTGSGQAAHLFGAPIAVDSGSSYDVKVFGDTTSLTSGEFGFYIDEYNAEGGTDNVEFAHFGGETPVIQCAVYNVKAGGDTIPPAPKPQCSDSVDNDNDQLVDANDPQCHVDGDLEKEYLPTWDNESAARVDAPTGGQGGDGDSDNGGSSHRSHGGSSKKSTSGSVLGASTSACGPLLDGYVGVGKPNTIENITRLHIFLNAFENANLPLNGKYDAATIAAVNAFQVKYNIEVLKPWYDIGLLPTPTTSTSYVYKTTQRMINNLYCPTLNLPIPQLP